jgi:hypothetical protein
MNGFKIKTAGTLLTRFDRSYGGADIAHKRVDLKIILC